MADYDMDLLSKIFQEKFKNFNYEFSELIYQDLAAAQICSQRIINQSIF